MAPPGVNVNVVNGYNIVSTDVEYVDELVIDRLNNPPPLPAVATVPAPAAALDTIFASCHTVPFTETASDDPRLVRALPPAIHIFAPENQAAPVP